MQISRGLCASVAPGGRGFKCPKAGCEAFFDTADEALAHGAQVCGVASNGRGLRWYDAAGTSRCLWDGCGRVMSTKRPNAVDDKDGNLGTLLSHEALHEKGEAPLATFVTLPRDDLQVPGRDERGRVGARPRIARHGRG